VKRFAAFLLLVLALLSNKGTALAEELPPEISAGGSALMEAGSMRLLAGEHTDVRLPMASTTKIMTCLLAIEHCDLDAMVRIPDAAVGVEGSSMYLARGEMLSMRDLLYGLMLTSGNDAAVAIAITVAGSVEAFAEMMNARAREIGCTDTNFVTPNGLHDENHYTTAQDLCRIACTAMQSEVFQSIVSTEYHRTETGDKSRTLKNKNRILWQYEGGNGVKTGYTKKSGRCLVFSAKRGKTQLVGVVLNCPDMWNAAESLLDYGFASYETQRLLDGGTRIGYIPVDGGVKNGLQVCPKEDILYPLAKTNTDALRWELDCAASVQAPAEAGDVLGYLTLYVNDLPAKRAELVAAESVAAADYGFYLEEILSRFRPAI